MQDSSTRTRANATPVLPPQEDLDDVTVTKSKVESVMNHRRLQEGMRAPAFSGEEFAALSSVDAYFRAARDGFARVIQLFSKDIQVNVHAFFDSHVLVAPET